MARLLAARSGVAAVTVCTICGSHWHRASKCPYRACWLDKAIAIAFALAVTGGWVMQYRAVLYSAAVTATLLLSGCAVSVPADTLCLLPRPAAALADTAGTQAKQKKAAAVWDRRCTVMGAWR